MVIVFVIIVLLPSLPVWGAAVYFSFALMRKKRYQKKGSRLHFLRYFTAVKS